MVRSPTTRRREYASVTTRSRNTDATDMVITRSFFSERGMFLAEVNCVCYDYDLPKSRLCCTGEKACSDGDPGPKRQFCVSALKTLSRALPAVALAAGGFSADFARKLLAWG